MLISLYIKRFKFFAFVILKIYYCFFCLSGLESFISSIKLLDKGIEAQLPINC